MDFNSMKRKELQVLCKENGIPANLKNVEMATRLSALFKVKKRNGAKSCLKNMDDNDNDDDVVVDDVIVDDEDEKIEIREGKRVRFSPQNEMFEFEKTDPREWRLLARKRRVIGKSELGKNPGLACEDESVSVEGKNLGRNSRRKSVVHPIAVCENASHVEEEQPVGSLRRRKSVVGKNPVAVCENVGCVEEQQPMGSLRRRKSVVGKDPVPVCQDVGRVEEEPVGYLRRRKSVVGKFPVAVCENVGRVEEPVGRNLRRKTIVKSNVVLGSQEVEKPAVRENAERISRRSVVKPDVRLVPDDVEDVEDHVEKEEPERNLRPRGRMAKKKDLEADSLSPCVEKKGKGSRKGDQNVEEAVDRAGNVVTRRQLRSREVRVEKSSEGGDGQVGVTEMTKSTKEGLTGKENVMKPTKRSSRQKEKGKAKDSATVSKGQGCNDVPNEDDSKKDVERPVEMALDNKKRKRAGKNTSTTKQQESKEVSDGGVDQQNVCVKKADDSLVAPVGGKSLDQAEKVKNGPRRKAKKVENDGDYKRRSTRQAGKTKVDASLSQNVIDDSVPTCDDHMDNGQNQMAQVVNSLQEAQGCSLERDDTVEIDHASTKEIAAGAAALDYSLQESKSQVEEQNHASGGSIPVVLNALEFDGLAQVSENSSQDIHVVYDTTESEGYIESKDSLEKAPESSEVDTLSPTNVEDQLPLLLQNSVEDEATGSMGISNVLEVHLELHAEATDHCHEETVPTPPSTSVKKFDGISVSSVSVENSVDATAKASTQKSCEVIDISESGDVLSNIEKFVNDEGTGTGPYIQSREKQASEQENEFACRVEVEKEAVECVNQVCEAEGFSLEKAANIETCYVLCEETTVGAVAPDHNLLLLGNESEEEGSVSEQQHHATEGSIPIEQSVETFDDMTKSEEYIESEDVAGKAPENAETNSQSLEKFNDITMFEKYGESKDIAGRAPENAEANSQSLANCGSLATSPMQSNSDGQAKSSVQTSNVPEPLKIHATPDNSLQGNKSEDEEQNHAAGMSFSAEQRAALFEGFTQFSAHNSKHLSVFCNPLKSEDDRESKDSIEKAPDNSEENNHSPANMEGLATPLLQSSDVNEATGFTETSNVLDVALELNVEASNDCHEETVSTLPSTSREKFDGASVSSVAVKDSVDTTPVSSKVTNGTKWRDVFSNIEKFASDVVTKAYNQSKIKELHEQEDNSDSMDERENEVVRCVNQVCETKGPSVEMTGTDNSKEVGACGVVSDDSVPGNKSEEEKHAVIVLSTCIEQQSEKFDDMTKSEDYTQSNDITGKAPETPQASSQSPISGHLAPSLLQSGSSNEAKSSMQANNGPEIPLEMLVEAANNYDEVTVSTPLSTSARKFNATPLGSVAANNSLESSEPVSCSIAKSTIPGSSKVINAVGDLGDERSNSEKFASDEETKSYNQGCDDQLSEQENGIEESNQLSEGSRNETGTENQLLDEAAAAFGKQHDQLIYQEEADGSRVRQGTVSEAVHVAQEVSDGEILNESGVVKANFQLSIGVDGFAASTEASISTIHSAVEVFESYKVVPPSDNCEPGSSCGKSEEPYAAEIQDIDGTEVMSESFTANTSALIMQSQDGGELTSVLGSLKKGEQSSKEKFRGYLSNSDNSKKVERAQSFTDPKLYDLDAITYSKNGKEPESKKAARVLDDNVFALGGEGLREHLLFRDMNTNEVASEGNTSPCTVDAVRNVVSECISVPDKTKDLQSGASKDAENSNYDLFFGGDESASPLQVQDRELSKALYPGNSFSSNDFKSEVSQQNSITGSIGLKFLFKDNDRSAVMESKSYKYSLVSTEEELHKVPQVLDFSSPVAEEKAACRLENLCDNFIAEGSFGSNVGESQHKVKANLSDENELEVEKELAVVEAKAVKQSCGNDNSKSMEGREFHEAVREQFAWQNKTFDSIEKETATERNETLEDVQGKTVSNGGEGSPKITTGGEREEAVAGLTGQSTLLIPVQEEAENDDEDETIEECSSEANNTGQAGMEECNCLFKVTETGGCLQMNPGNLEYTAVPLMHNVESEEATCHVPTAGYHVDDGTVACEIESQCCQDGLLPLEKEGNHTLQTGDSMTSVECANGLLPSPMENASNIEAMTDVHDSPAYTRHQELVDVEVRDMAQDALPCNPLSTPTQETRYEDYEENSEATQEKGKEDDVPISGNKCYLFDAPENERVFVDNSDDRHLNSVGISVEQTKAVVRLENGEHGTAGEFEKSGEACAIGVECFSEPCDMGIERDLDARVNTNDLKTSAFASSPQDLKDFGDELRKLYASPSKSSHHDTAENKEQADSCLFTTWEMDFIWGQMAENEGAQTREGASEANFCIDKCEDTDVDDGTINSAMQQPEQEGVGASGEQIANQLEQEEVGELKGPVNSIEEHLHGKRNQTSIDIGHSDIKGTDVDNKVMRSSMTKMKKRSILIHGTPTKPTLFTHDMKENTPVPKNLPRVDVTAVKPFVKRKALEDLKQ